MLSELHQLYSAADMGATTTLLAKLAIEKSHQAKLEDTRQACCTHTLYPILSHDSPDGGSHLGHDWGWMQLASIHVRDLLGACTNICRRPAIDLLA